MAAAQLSCLLAALSANRPLASFLAVGLIVLFILFAILVWTRFGQARPVSKCVVLSLLAHLLLVIYAYSTHILNGPPGSWTGRAVTMRIRDAADDMEAAPAISSSPKQWEQPGESNAPLLLAAEADKKNEKTKIPPRLHRRRPQKRSLKKLNPQPNLNTSPSRPTHKLNHLPRQPSKSLKRRPRSQTWPTCFPTVPRLWQIPLSPRRQKTHFAAREQNPRNRWQQTKKTGRHLSLDNNKISS